MTEYAQVELRPLRRAKIVTLILVAAVVVLSVSVAPKFTDLLTANSEIAHAAGIDIWQLHLQADIEHMPTLTVIDPI